MSSNGPDAAVGRVLDGRYRVLSRVAHGGMATVYLARDQRLDRDVAVKVMRPDLARDEAFVARFRREAQLAAGLSHPNIVAVHDFGEDEGDMFLVMEYVEGQTLRDRLSAEGALSVRESLRVVDAVLQALDVAHSAGLIHRDVKPENVILRANGQVKVADFGLARAVTAATTTNQSGILLGTVAYLSPEQVERGVADARSDVYAAGLVLYEMLTGQKAFQGDTPIHVAYQHVHGSVPVASDRVATVPVELDQLVSLATARDPAGRPETAGDLLAEVRRTTANLSAAELDARPWHRAQGLPPTLVHPVSPSTSSTSNSPNKSSSPNTSSSPGSLSGTEAASSATATAVLSVGPGPTRTSPAALLAPGSGTVASTDPFDRSVAATDPFDRSAVAPHSGPTHLPAAPANRAPATPPGSGGSDPGQSADRGSLAASAETAPHHRRRQHRRWAAAVLVALVALGAGWWWWGVLGPGSVRIVPAVAGLGVSDAEAVLRGVDLRADVVRVYDETAPKDLVMTSDPVPGAEVRRSTPVRVAVSLGPERYAVPALVGASRADVEAKLAERHLVLGALTEAFHETVPAGVILAQDPAADSSVKRDTPVVVVVSKGREPIPVTDFTGKAADAAEQALVAAGLKVTRGAPVNSDTVAEGLVVSQAPVSGTLFRGDTVTIVVSKGPVLVPVPATVGKQRGEAKAILEAAGFQVAFNEVLGGFFGTVRASNPAGGTLARKGATVTLTIV